jgi:pyrroline-5-carboxylate reductase
VDGIRKIHNEEILSPNTHHLSIAGTVSGCGPAVTSMFIEALSDAAVMNGLPRDISYKLASQMVVGIGKLQLITNTHPGIMKELWFYMMPI